MKRIDAAIDRLLLFVGKRASERQIFVLAGLFYGGIGLVVPVFGGWPTPWFVFANLVGAMLAFSFLLVWIAVQVQLSRRRNLLEWASDLRRLDAQEFEWLVGELLRREGWHVEEIGRHGEPDGGIDLWVTRGKERAAVQCKRWTSHQVPVAEVRSFAGVLNREGLPAEKGILVTLSDYTPQARADAALMKMTLIDGPDLYRRIEAVRTPEPCPICGTAMLFGRSPHGWWFRCVAEGCNGKRDLGREPAQAIELLTQGPDS